MATFNPIDFMYSFCKNLENKNKLFTRLFYNTNIFRLCLQIMPDIEDSVAHEWNLISAMTIFNTFGTKILPVQGETFILDKCYKS